jgi:hypothetical protein
MFTRACATGWGLLLIGLLPWLLSAAPMPGSLDLSFQPSGWITNGIETVMVRRDGQILVGQSRPAQILRLHNDGSEVETFPFPPSAEWAGYYNLQEQADGKILWQGDYRSPGDEQSRKGIFRMNLDGTLDSSFVPTLQSNRSENLITVAEGYLVSSYDYSEQRGYLHRLRRDGSLDSSFAEIQFTNMRVFDVVATRSNVLLIGWAGAMNQQRGTVAILNHTGHWVTNIALPWTNSAIPSLISQTENKFLIWSQFATNDGTSTALYRVGLDGAVDPSFQPIVYPGWFSAMTDGENRILIAGRFGDPPSSMLNRIARFTQDGRPDTLFIAPELTGYFSSLHVQADGQILIEGNFLIPTNIPVASLARLHGDNPPPIASLSWRAQEYRASESASNAVLTLMRSHALGAVTFDFATQDGTARAGEHYLDSTGRVRFVAGSLTADIQVPLVDNQLVDGERTFGVTLSNVAGAEMTDAAATAVITNDEVTNRVQFAAGYFPIKETEGNASVEVVRDFGSPGAVSVRYRTRNDTARAGRDYQGVNGVVHFAEGQFTNRFLVPIRNTTDADGNRYARLELFAPQNGAVLGHQAHATLAILDDESPAMIVVPTEAFVRAAVAGGGTVQFATDGTVQLSSDVLIDRSTSIEANGHAVIFSGDGATRHFTIAEGADVTLTGLTLINGQSTNGGSIYNAGTLTLRDCVFSNNVARGLSGLPGLPGTNGLANPSNTWVGTPAGHGENGTAAQPAAGGAIFSAGNLTAFNCSFLANAAVGGDGGSGGGGGHTAGVTSPGSGGDGGNAGAAQGGAVFLSGGGRFDACKFVGNQARAGIGGAFGVPGTNVHRDYQQERVAGTSGLAADASGGAIHSSRPLALAGCRFERNLAVASTGGDGASQGYPGRAGPFGSPGMHGGHGRNGGGASGGALRSIGVTRGTNNVWIYNSSLAGSGGAGGAGGSATYATSRRSGGDGGDAGHGGSASGGAIASADSLLLHGDLFLSNSVVAGFGGAGGNGGASDGGAYGHNPDAGMAGDGGHAEGGAIAHRGSLIAARIRIAGNSAKAGRGGRPANPGTGHTGIYVSAGAPGYPGAIGDAFGGAVFVDGHSEVTECEFTFNSAEGGAGVDGWSSPYYRLRFDGPDGGSGRAGGSALGGGAHFTGTAVLQRITIASNIAIGGAGGAGGIGVYSMYEASRGGWGAAGGDAVGGGVFLRGSAQITNVTIAFNECRPGRGGNGGSGDPDKFSPSAWIDPTLPGGNAGRVMGAGLAIGAQSSATLAFSTIASNHFLPAPGGVGGAYGTWFKAPDGNNTVVLGTAIAGDGDVTLGSCILAANPSTPQLGTNVVDDGFNLSSDPAAPFDHPQSLTGTDPLIGPLADNGGPTRTMALLSGSPAIDAGDDANCPPTDQRGVSRPFGVRCDIGAFELNERTFSISGQVRNQGPNGIRISAGPLSTWTDALGRYAMKNLVAGTYEVLPQGDDTEYSPLVRTVVVGPDASDVDFTSATARLECAPAAVAGMLSLRVSGLPGESFAVETSTNLIDWSLLQFIEVSTNGTDTVQHAVSTNDVQRYFRLRRR